MRNKFSFIFVSILGIFINGIIYADTHVNPNPPETIVMTISNDDNLHWKEISRVITDEECLVERIPYDQDKENWSELITIQYFSKAVINKEIRESIERVVNQLKNVTLARYPKDTVVWRVIEKNKDDLLFEWILTKPYKNSLPQHEICRAFLTPTSFHRIGVTKKYKEMNQEERNQWIKALRESTEIISYEAALNFPQGLSLATVNGGPSVSALNEVQMEEKEREAQYLRGLKFHQGRGEEKNLKKAFYWYEKSAQQGYSKAQNELGCMYLHGQGTGLDLVKAKEWFEKAAVQGESHACYALGIMHAVGRGSVKNEATAVSWFEKAAHLGHEEARTSLIVMYSEGMGIPKNTGRAKYWQNQSVNQKK